MSYSRRSILKTIGAGSLVAFGNIPLIAKASAKYNWRFAHVGAVGGDQAEFANKFAALLAEKTQGAVAVTTHPAGQMGGEQDLFQQVRGQALEFCLQGLPGIANLGVKEAMLLDLPYVVTDREQGWRLLNGDFGTWMRDTIKTKTGNYPLSFLDNGFRHVYNRLRPIETPADLVGLKLRALQAPAYVAVYEHLKAIPIPLAYPEVYSALQAGVIDGGEGSSKQVLQDKFFEVAKFFSLTSINYNAVVFLTNDAFFNGLPKDIQKAMTEATAEATAYQSTISRKMDADALVDLKKAGVKVNEPDLAPFVAAVKPDVWNKIESQIPNGKENVARLFEALKKVS